MTSNLIPKDVKTMMKSADYVPTLGIRTGGDGTIQLDQATSVRMISKRFGVQER